MAKKMQENERCTVFQGMSQIFVAFVVVVLSRDGQADVNVHEKNNGSEKLSRNLRSESEDACECAAEVEHSTRVACTSLAGRVSQLVSTLLVRVCCLRTVLPTYVIRTEYQIVMC